MPPVRFGKTLANVAKARPVNIMTMNPAVRMKEELAKASRKINAVVVSSGLMDKTVKVRVGIQEHNWHIGKDFSRYQSLLVHDPASSLRTGDIVSISPGFRASKHVRHVVNSILAPFGEPIEDRPPIPSEEERWIAAHNKKIAKDARRAEVKRQLDEVVAAVVGEELGTKEVDWKQKGRQEKMKKKKRSDRQTAVLGSRPIERENTASRKVDFKS